MRKSIFLIFIFLLPLISAEPTLVTLRDITNNQGVDDVAIFLTSADFTYTYYLPTGEILSLDSLPDQDVIIKVDDFKTTGIDYFGIISPSIKDQETATIFLEPVGSIQGIVKDSLDNIVPFSEIKCDCGDCADKTDAFGSFFVDSAKVGSCKIFANFKDSTGSADIEIIQGNVVEAEILLDKSILVNDNNSNSISLVLVFAVLILILIFLILKLMRKSKLSIHGKTIDKEGAISVSTKKIISTLNDNEKTVVDYLLNHHNSANQANIRHATRIARTSLARTIEHLQRKNIINIEKHGKSVKISLTDFFLSDG